MPRGKFPLDSAVLPPFRSGCPIASSLDLVGDRWTLVLLRTMALGATTYGQFQAIPEGIASNILADRLRQMTAFGLVHRVGPGRGRRAGYGLTKAGAELLTVVQALAAWGVRNLPDRWVPPADFMAALPENVVAPAGA